MKDGGGSGVIGFHGEGGGVGGGGGRPGEMMTSLKVSTLPCDYDAGP